MPEIIKVYREAAPKSRLIGIRYTDSDRENGSYAARWGEWFARNHFGLLEALEPVEGSYLGAMRMGLQGFEYWIGMLLPAGTTPPEGFDSADLPAGETGVVWLKGREDAELYACHDECLAARDHPEFCVNL